MPDIAQKRARFRALHETGCFLIPNPWDPGSARWLERLGFPALATTSSGSAWAQGWPDGGLSLEETLAHFRAMASAVEVPLNADFMCGWAADADGVARNVARVVETGVAGLSIEDATGEPDRPLFEREEAVERVAAARAAIDKAGGDVVLTARSEGFIAGRPDLDETLARLRAFAEAGADCLYAPGIGDPAQIAAVVEAVAPKPVNVLVGRPGLSVAQLADLGVRRISVGGAFARAALGELDRCARELREHGTFEGLGRALSFPEVEAAFSG